MSAIEITFHLPVSSKRLWTAWTNQDQVSKWFSPEAHIEPHIDGAYELFFDPSNHNHMSTIDCKITEIQPPYLLGFQWKGPDQYADLMNKPPKTHVEITMTPIETGTTLNIKHKGWETGPAWSDAKKWHKTAWTGVLQELENYLNQN